MYAAICPVLTNIARWTYSLAQPEESQKIKFIFARFRKPYFADDPAPEHAALLLGVDREMLDTGIDALALDTLYIRGSHLAGQIGIL